jgi:cardiolipin synthase
VRPQPNPGFTADHSKVLLVDGRYVFLGGMNIGREYRYEWHDLMAEIQGPIVASFERKFDKKWAQVGPWGDAALTVEGLRTQPGGPTAPAGTNLIALRRLYTRPFDHQIRCAELEAIKRASSYVFAENPYFFSNEFLIALTRARKRGVDVRVLMPSENDLGIGHNSNLVIANYFLEHGVRVYFYPGMTHVKALLSMAGPVLAPPTSMP